MPEPSHLANLNLLNVREQQFFPEFLNLSVTWLSQQHSKFDIAQDKTIISSRDTVLFQADIPTIY